MNREELIAEQVRLVFGDRQPDSWEYQAAMRLARAVIEAACSQTVAPEAGAVSTPRCPKCGSMDVFRECLPDHSDAVRCGNCHGTWITENLEHFALFFQSKFDASRCTAVIDGAVCDRPEASYRHNTESSPFAHKFQPAAPAVARRREKMSQLEMHNLQKKYFKAPDTDTVVVAWSDAVAFAYEAYALGVKEGWKSAGPPQPSPEGEKPGAIE